MSPRQRQVMERISPDDWNVAYMAGCDEGLVEGRKNASASGCWTGWRNGGAIFGLTGFAAGVLLICLAAVTRSDENNPDYQRGKRDGIHEAKEMIEPLLKKINKQE